MMGLTQDGQLNEELVRARDARFKVSTAEEKAKRKDIRIPTPDKEANSWEKGKSVQLILVERDVKKP